MVLIPYFLRMSGLPIPESSKIWGVLMVPPETMASPPGLRLTSYVFPLETKETDCAVAFAPTENGAKLILVTWAEVMTLRFFLLELAK